MNARTRTVDFDLHSLATIRVEDATDSDVQVVRRQLGPLPTIVDRAPDITIRFADKVEAPSRLRYIGARDAGWTEEAFYILKNRNESCVVRFPIERIGGPCEIVCQRGLAEIPFLIATVNLTALANGGLPLHAGAFALDGRGVLVTGWSKGGRSELLLAATASGARYIGDGWVYLTADGSMHGIPEPIRLWDSYLDQLPTVRARLGRRARLKLRTLPVAGRAEARLPTAVRRTSAGRFLRRAVPVIDAQRHVKIAPERLFGPLQPLTGRMDHVLFVVSAAGDRMSVEPIDPAEVAQRMVASLVHERLDLAGLYLQARFAFPGLSNRWLDEAEALQADRLAAFLAGRPAHVITHPYPVDFDAFLEAARSVL